MLAVSSQDSQRWLRMVSHGDFGAKYTFIRGAMGSCSWTYAGRDCCQDLGVPQPLRQPATSLPGGEESIRLQVPYLDSDNCTSIYISEVAIPYRAWEAVFAVCILI